MTHAVSLYIQPCIPTRATRRPRPNGSTKSSTTATGCRCAATARPSACSPAAATTGPSAIRHRRHAATLRARSFTVDGEAVVCGSDGVAIFDALHRRGTVSEAMLYAFDLLELDGEDLRARPLGDRKKRLAKLLGGRAGIVLSEHTDEDGATIFRQACRMGLEGIVSKRLSAPYRSGPSRDWLKVKNPDSPAMVWGDVPPFVELGGAGAADGDCCAACRFSSTVGLG